MAGLLSAGVWLPVPLCMPGLWRDERAVVRCSQLSGLHGCECWNCSHVMHAPTCCCVPIVCWSCATVIGWSVGVVWVLGHEQNEFVARLLSAGVWLPVPLCCRGCGDTGGQWLAEMGWRLHEDHSAAWILTVICAVDGRVVGFCLTSSSSATITSSTISGNSAVSFVCAPLGALIALLLNQT